MKSGIGGLSLGLFFFFIGEIRRFGDTYNHFGGDIFELELILALGAAGDGGQILFSGMVTRSPGRRHEWRLADAFEVGVVGGIPEGFPVKTGLISDAQQAISRCDDVIAVSHGARAWISVTCIACHHMPPL